MIPQYKPVVSMREPNINMKRQGSSLHFNQARVIAIVADIMIKTVI